MKLSKVFHVASVVPGVLGVLAFFGVWGGTMFGGSAILLVLVAIWLQLATIHHMMLEKKGEIV